MAAAKEFCPRCNRECRPAHLRANDGICFICTGKPFMDADTMARVTARGLMDTSLRLAIINHLMVIGAVIGPTGLCKG